MAIIEHDFDNGLTVWNAIVADYQKFYQNVYPASGRSRRGQSRPDRVQSRRLPAQDQRDNVFNQTDFTYKT